MSVIDTFLDYVVAANQIAFEHTERLLWIPAVIILLAFLMRKGGFSLKKIWFILKRFLLFSLILAAIASPYILESQELPRKMPPITLLVDESASMGLFENVSNEGRALRQDLVEIIGNLSSIPPDVSIQTFSRGNSTSIGDVLYSQSVHSQSSSNIIILLSDGQNIAGKNPLEVSRALGKANSSVLVINPKIQRPEVLITNIVGERKIPLKAEYTLYVEVEKVTPKPVNYKIEIFVDGSKRFGTRETQSEAKKYYPLSLSFSDVGIHEIRAEITPSSAEQDTFLENNIFYKGVEVIDKPRILVIVGNETSSPLVQVLDDLYDVTVTRSPQLSQLSQYNAIVVDNLPTTKMVKGLVDRLRDYVIDGNGIWVVGGSNSFEYGGYYNSDFENLLPVRSIPKPKELRKPISIVFLLDVSNSFSYSPDPQTKSTKLDVEKAIVLKMMKELKDDDLVGVIAMNAGDFALTNGIERFGDIRDDIQNDILQLIPGGGTILIKSLETSQNLFSGRGEKKFLVIISDGVFSKSQKKLSLEKISQLSDYGVKTYTIGLGFDTDEYYMSEIAKAGDGLYLKPEGYQRLKLEFGREAEAGDSDASSLMVRDQYHYITHNLELPESAVSDFNKVNEKSTARVLVTAKGDQPIVTVWNFGLGRVAALSTDNGLHWAPRVYDSEKGRLVASITNWVLGDMEKHKKVRISTKDLFLGEEALFEIKSESRPELIIEKGDSREREDAPLKRREMDSYQASFIPQETGFYSILAAIEGEDDIDLIAVNYEMEFSKLGVNEDVLGSMAQLGAGKLYGMDELDSLKEDILEYAKKETVEEVTEKRPLWHIFLVLALAFYFIDAVYMRIRELFKKR
ncbi:MAG: VWA domain-containing protein [Candidatus Altiarchaeota archaeon]